MAHGGKYHGIGFIAGLCLCAVYLLFRKNGVIERYGSFEYALLVSTVLLTLASLPSIVGAVKKEAVPAQKSDIIGYAIIFMFLLFVSGIGYFVLR